MIKLLALRSWFSVSRLIVALLVSSLIAGCGTAPPRNSENICAIFKQYPRWYWDAKSSYQRWGIPVYVQLAMVRQESSFQSDARPPRSTILGFIPGPRPTTAYGYAQAVNDTWLQYQQTTGQYKGNRDQFGAATDFMGWYSSQAARQLKIKKTDAYNLYLAYHEGINGYSQGTYKQKPWLIQVAKKVQGYANLYKIQLQSCEKSIPAPSVWNLWLN